MIDLIISLGFAALVGIGSAFFLGKKTQKKKDILEAKLKTLKEVEIAHEIKQTLDNFSSDDLDDELFKHARDK